jgi:hypothetical protein
MKNLIAVLLLALAVTSPVRAAAPIDFGREIQPILADHCFQCHGKDEQTRQGGLRLDLRETALKGGESEGPAIVPGKPEVSGMIARLTTEDPDQAMPPPKSDWPATFAAGAGPVRAGMPLARNRPSDAQPDRAIVEGRTLR